MNLVRNLAALAITLTLGVAVAPGCGPKKPNGTSNPPGGSNASGGGGATSGGGSSASSDDAGGEAGGDGGGAPTTCEAKVAGAPVPLFEEKVLIRPPVNVELVEDNPTFATTYASAGFVSACDATVDRMSLFVFQNDPKKKLGTYLDEVVNEMLPKSGYQNGTRDKNYLETDTDAHTGVEYPAADGAPPAKLYIAVARRFDNVFVILYQTRPDEFVVLKPTFEESAKSLLVIPPDA